MHTISSRMANLNEYKCMHIEHAFHVLSTGNSLEEQITLR